MAKQISEMTDMFIIEAFPGRQGGRNSASTSLTIKEILNLVAYQPAKKNQYGFIDSDGIKEQYNRPVDSKHVDSIVVYLKRNFREQYIVPPITLALSEKISVISYPSISDNNKENFFLLMNRNRKSLIIIDGQHRIQAFDKWIHELEMDDDHKTRDDILDQTLTVMINFESDRRSIHQDFADCGKTLALSNSILSIYDQRLSFNKVVDYFTYNCELFNKGLTDGNSKSLGSASRAFIITSSLKTYLKTLATGNPSMSTKAFDEWCEANFTDESLAEFEKFALNVTEKLIFNIDILHKISKLEEHSEARAVIPSIRKRYLIANPVGLNIAAKIIYDVKNSDVEKINEVIEDLGKFDWGKNNKFWHDNIVTPIKFFNENNNDSECHYKYSISANNAPFKVAYMKMKEYLGLV
ncbi:DGQHR domain-containing protein [Photobacterium japonica]|uniref:DNA sulfur modification protein DndB n=1 Tax=Photobacterium japonica TaxID=2910235 RepID=UPI003D131709